MRNLPIATALVFLGGGCSSSSTAPLRPDVGNAMDAEAIAPDAAALDAAALDTDLGAVSGPIYVDVSATHLPGTLNGFSMDARPSDIDGDGDLDLVIASEFRTNLLLINDGRGRMMDASDAQLPRTRRDSEDVVIHDFDGDGALDIFIASEDDQTNELYLRRGEAFVDASDRIPVRGTSNAAILWRGSAPGVLLGNAGQNFALRWSSEDEAFVDVTAEVLPARIDQTQDLELADVDGDGDVDLLVGNEDDSVVLLWEGARFDALIRLAADAETREIDAFDADGDGDLDLVLGNISFLRRDVSRRNRLLIQTSPLRFEDQSALRLPEDDDDTFDIDAVDVDGDGDLDLVTANLDSLSGRTANAPYRVYLNDGAGMFEVDETVLPDSARGNGFDIEAADFNGDGRLDLFLASRGGPDRLLLARP